MAEFFGTVMRGLGSLLAGFYSLTGSYAVAIILLTLVVRALLFPLMLKQIRSMAAMQKLQPEMKRIQEKYKAAQKKVRDRMELQQLRMEQQRETQELFRQHGVNPLSGCLPMLAQMPVFIAMFSVMRATIVVIPMTASLVSPGGQPSGDITAATFGRPLEQVVCRPVDAQGNELVGQRIDVTGRAPSRISCDTADGSKIFEVSGFRDANTERTVEQAGWITACRPALNPDDKVVFSCRSAVGAGHLPRDSKLFRDVTRDRATILGMHPGCTPNQVNSEEKARECTTDPDTGGTADALPYYLLVVLIGLTGYYSARQMTRRQTSQGQQPAAAQQQAIAKIMPVAFALFSLQFPTGLNFYYLFFNVTQIVQQHFQFKMQPAAAAAAPEKRIIDQLPEAPQNGGAPPRDRKPQQGSKKKKKKRKR